MNALITALATVYARENIRHPNLRAVTLAQWLLDSADGTSKLAQHSYNFGGLQWRPEMAGVAVPVTMGSTRWCQFATLESFINGYWRFLERAPYSGWEEHTASAQDFIGFIGPIYSGAAGYAARVLARLPDAQALLQAAAAAVPVPAASLGTIVIDPGHGGTAVVGGSSPNNAISASGVKEKKLTLDLALMLAAHVKSQAQAAGRDVRVVLTRDGDFNVGIADRAARAKAEGADLFISLHFNGAQGTARGCETFYADASHGNVNLQADMAFAQQVQTGLLKGISAAGLTPKDRGIKPDTASGPGSIGVLRDSSLGNVDNPKPCRAVLTEIEFIDHPDVDRVLIAGPGAVAARGALAEQLARALIAALQAPTT